MFKDLVISSIMVCLWFSSKKQIHLKEDYIELDIIVKTPYQKIFFKILSIYISTKVCMNIKNQIGLLNEQIKIINNFKCYECK